MGKIRNFLCFFICSFLLNCPTTEEQITDRQVLLGVIQKVSSNSKHTLLCLYGHNILARINLIPLKTLRWFAQVAGGAKPTRNGSFSLCPKDETNKLPKNGGIENHSSG